MAEFSSNKMSKMFKRFIQPFKKPLLKFYSKNNFYTSSVKETDIFPAYTQIDKTNLLKDLLTKKSQINMERAKSLIQLERWEQAKSTLSAIATPQSFAYYGACLLHENKIEEAREYFENSIEKGINNLTDCIEAIINLDNPDFYLEAQRLTQKYSKSEEISNEVDLMVKNEYNVATYEAFCKYKPLDWRVWFKYGSLVYNQKQDLNTALKSLDRAMELTSYYLPIYQKAIILLENSMHFEGVPLLQKIVNISPKATSLQMLHLAECLFYLMRLQDALYHLNKSIEIDPDNQYARKIRGRILLQNRNNSEALEDLKVAYEKDPEDSDSTYWYAIGLHENNKLQSSLEILNKFLEKNPKSPTGWLQKGLCIYKIYHLKYDSNTQQKSNELFLEAISCFEKCIEVDPGYARGYFMLADVNLSLGETEKAKEYVRTGVKINPHDPSGQELAKKLDLD